MRLRAGRRVPRNLYLHPDDDPGGQGQDVGRVDSAGLALIIVTVFNACLPECAVICRLQGCGEGPAHCRYAHLPEYVPEWHGPAECPWEGLSAKAAAGERRH